MDASETLQTVVPGTASGERLDRFLAQALDGLSRSRLKALIEAGHVQVAGRTIVEPKYPVKPGEAVTVAAPPAEPAEPEAQNIPLEVLFEDDHLIVVNKPAGMVVHPAAGNPDGTLVNALIAHCGDSLSGIGGVRRPGIVHRLDKDTSGVMVAAKTDAAHAGLAGLFAAHDIDRMYLALVRGAPVRPRGVIEGAIGRHPKDRKRMAVRREGGKPATTHYRVVRRFGEAASLLECTLETGRTHQIRVHLAHLGHPVIGDPVYGPRRGGAPKGLDEKGRGAVQVFPRQALHAARLGFAHPVTGEALRCEAAPPEDLDGLIRTLLRSVI
jgi:23S rRNA pseudouridine1911/1915/1917 synthase